MSRTRKHELTGAKAVSHQCENHGSCEWCRRNRTYNELRDKEKAEYDEKEFRNNNVMAEADINKIVHLAKVEFCRCCWCGIPRDTCTSLGTCDEHDNFVKAFRKQLMDNYYEMDKSRG